MKIDLNIIIKYACIAGVIYLSSELLTAILPLVANIINCEVVK